MKPSAVSKAATAATGGRKKHVAGRESDDAQNIDENRGSTSSSAAKKTRLTQWRKTTDQKVVGLKRVGLDASTYEKRRNIMVGSNHSRTSSKKATGAHHHHPTGKFSVEEMEEQVHSKAIRNPFQLLYLGNLAALKVMLYYMSE